MFAEFWKLFQDESRSRWLPSAFMPVAVFWIGGGMALFFGHFIDVGYRVKAFEAWINRLTSAEQVFCAVSVVIILYVTAVLIEKLDFTVIRFLEGYWPRTLGGIRRWRIRTYRRHYKDKMFDLANLEAKREKNIITSDEEERLTLLDSELYNYPGRVQLMMPTLFGNRMRAAESRINDWYGLDPITLWPRLWLILPDTVKAEVGQARSVLNMLARGWLLGILFAVWSFWAWWALIIAILVAFYCYRQLLASATIFGDLFVAAFEIHRFDLYRMLRWRPPVTTADEIERGRLLTRYLQRGPLARQETFADQQAAEDKRMTLKATIVCQKRQPLCDEDDANITSEDASNRRPSDDTRSG